MALRTLLRCAALSRAGAHVLSAIVRVFLVFPFLSERQRRQQIQSWSSEALAIFGLRAVPMLWRGEALRPASLLVANHVSWLDVFAIWATTETQFVAKTEVARWPLIGPLARRLGVIFIDRTRRTDALVAGKIIAEQLSLGRSVCIFPEGTTTEGDQLQPFRPALFQPAIDAHVQIQPLAIRYLRADGKPAPEAAFTGEMSLVQSMWRLAAAGPLTIDLAFLPSVATDGHNRRDLAEICQSLVHGRLQEPALTSIERPLQESIEAHLAAPMRAAQLLV